MNDDDDVGVAKATDSRFYARFGTNTRNALAHNANRLPHRAALASARNGASGSVSVVRLPPSEATAANAQATTALTIGSPVTTVTPAPSAAPPNALRNPIASCVSIAHVFATSEFTFTKLAHMIQPKCNASGTSTPPYVSALTLAATRRASACARPNAHASAIKIADASQKCRGARNAGRNATHHSVCNAHAHAQYGTTPRTAATSPAFATCNAVPNPSPR
mmetsp:Transcript_1393/g.5081  ORF Transcript_1393/g.5081 Transcript_1393/m.5081 type:complete len:221 (+) Transcript_1393:76-738(+)